MAGLRRLERSPMEQGGGKPRPLLGGGLQARRKRRRSSSGRRREIAVQKGHWTQKKKRRLRGRGQPRPRLAGQPSGGVLLHELRGSSGSRPKQEGGGKVQPEEEGWGRRARKGLESWGHGNWSPGYRSREAPGAGQPLAVGSCGTKSITTTCPSIIGRPWYLGAGSCMPVEQPIS